MDIAGLSMALSAQSVQNDVGVLLLKKGLDTVEDLGEGMVSMMEASVTPNLGQNIDILI